ncbi:hypothetical protein [Sciscionella sediminilitoris]|uniref:hypothetical protein n=1 Tax=Sciscionella sediminilitoris TaxID=1445613 RepID=UPI00056D62F1|nr:hypothetical protein [Sciscionella sp. SE31]
MNDILDQIDAAIGCQQCGRELGDSPSDDFCSESCQQRWHAGRAGATRPWFDEVDPDAVARMLEAHNALAAVVRAFAEATAARLARAFQAASANLPKLTQPRPDAPMRRALQFQQQRNTGPRFDRHARLGRGQVRP